MSPRRPAQAAAIDPRTVGDLLLQADIAARQVLFDSPSHTATAKARSWGEVVEAAAELWDAIPDRDADPSMGRILRLTRGMHRTNQRTGWPGPGETDPRLDVVVEHLSRATDLVAGRPDPQRRLSGAAHRDSEAARTRIMHVVYLSAHGVSLALRRYHDGLRRVLDAKHTVQPGQSAVDSGRLLDRVSAAEQLAAAYLHGRWPAAMAGQHRPPVEPDRLCRAVAGWDVQARRTLAEAPDAADVFFTVTIERDLAVTGGQILTAAAHLGMVDPWQYAHRLRPALDTLDKTWASLGDAIGQVTGRARRADADLRRAGGELHASLHEITADLGAIASPTTMAGRADLDAATRQVRQGLTSAIDLGHVLGEVVRDPDLMGPARSVQAACQHLLVEPDDAAWVDAVDLQVNRPVLLPGELHTALAERSDAVIRAAVDVDSAAGTLDIPRAVPQAVPPSDGRAHQDRAVPTAGRLAPAHGLDR